MVLSILERLALRRRRPGAHPLWTILAVAAFVVRRLQRRSARDHVALSEELRPGETLVITHTTRARG